MYITRKDNCGSWNLVWSQFLEAVLWCQKVNRSIPTNYLSGRISGARRGEGVRGSEMLQRALFFSLFFRDSPSEPLQLPLGRENAPSAAIIHF
jgi:hypothetical protein